MNRETLIKNKWRLKLKRDIAIEYAIDAGFNDRDKWSCEFFCDLAAGYDREYRKACFEELREYEDSLKINWGD